MLCICIYLFFTVDTTNYSLFIHAKRLSNVRQIKPNQVALMYLVHMFPNIIFLDIQEGAHALGRVITAPVLLHCLHAASAHDRSQACWADPGREL